MGQRTITWDELVIKKLNRFMQKNLSAPKTNFSSVPNLFGIGSK